MQVTELSAEGLKRSFSVVVPAAEIEATRDKRLAALGRDLRIPGFRPGKVPASVVKKRYGTAVTGEVLEEQVQTATRTLLNDRGLRPALQPKVELVGDFADGQDLAFNIEMEVLPEVPMPDFSGIEVERPRAEPSEEEVQKALDGLATRQAKLEDVTEERPAAKGDIVMADFIGRLVTEGVSGNLMGAPGKDWAVVTNPRGAAKVAGSGEEDGALYADIEAPPGEGDKALSRISVTLGKVGFQAQAGETFALSLRWKVAAGAAPAIASARLSLSALDAEGKSLADEVANVAGPTGEAQEVSIRWTVPALEGLSAVQAALRITLQEPAAEGFTLRVGAVSLTRESGEGAVSAPFPGGTANDMPIEVGGEGFIPGFTEGLEGIRPGETRKIRVSFPEGYGSAELAGKPAEFEITAKALKTRAAAPANDEFAKSLGLESVEKLREELKKSIQSEYDGLTRLRVKRALLDQLSDRADFPVPEGMVEAEFGQIWSRVEQDRQAGRLDAEDAGKDEETLRAEYRKIAERRIRLGLLLSEIGRTNNIQVTQDELFQSMRNEASRYPGQEKQVFEFFQKNPQALENLRAPIFEEKVVDFMLELAKVTDTTVTPADLQAA
ncbi:trigger factor [Roseomonas rosea]|uniref:Trigger factor n=1 Tax=Muricoccus roseus TaxID=198092 RepID=A0A1M6E1K5_9PROT|nr:trigger factor [Roseomonas rosea]